MDLSSKSSEYLARRSLRRLFLNEYYYYHSERFNKIVKLIKVTRKGYNFLDEKTGKCIIYPHMYPWKKFIPKSPGEMGFWVDKKIKIKWVRNNIN